MRQMGELSENYSQHNGKAILKKIFREHLLTSTILTASAVGLKRKGLEILQLELNYKTAQRFDKRFSQIAEALKNEVNEQFVCSRLSNNKTVWSLWLQGEENAPDIVRTCLTSVKKGFPSYEHIILDENNLAEYVTLPRTIMEKYEDNKICDANFSDLVRMELLTRYGGIWSDATVFFSGIPYSFQIESPLYLFQTLPPGSSGESIPVSSWYIASQKPNRILLMTKALMFKYWEQFDYALDYFLVHYFFMMAARLYPEEWKRIIPCSNEAPQILSSKLFEPYEQDVYEAITQQTSIHKLTYKFDQESVNQHGTFYDRLVHGC